MVKNQRVDDVQQQKKEEDNMLFAARRIVVNTTNNALKPHFTNAATVISGFQKSLPSPYQQYSTDRPKQPSLLRFPAFPLDETLVKFLKSAQPFLNEQEYETAQKEVAEFACRDGKRLHEMLEKTAKTEQNWLAKRWLTTAYMQYRDPVTAYSSPGMTFPLQKFNDQKDFLNYTAHVIFFLLKYKAQIDANAIPVTKMGRFELDNSQFEKVLGTCRIPLPCEDTLEYHPQSQHVVVIYKNNFYKLVCYNRSDVLLDVLEIAKQLQIITESTTGDCSTPFGILSTDTRDNWAKAYAELLNASTGNACTMQTIRTSLFTVSLDEKVPDDGKPYNVMAEQLIHGGGSELNSGNRWMDKTIQLIVNPNGMSGFCYEHSPAEGQPIALMTDYVTKELSKKTTVAGACDDYEKAFMLPLISTPALDDMIETAKCNVDKLAKNLQLHVLHYKSYGKQFIKTQKLSPDSYIQMAIQYAFYILHQTPGAQYESAHLRIYAGGRTETIRSCSNESLAFVKAMTLCEGSEEERVQLLRTAVDAHRAYTNMALQGRGVDRHLLGLKLMAIEAGLEIPAFFSTEAVKRSANFRLSTSQVASNNSAYMCYAPLVANGYACCYNPRDADIFLSCAAWRDCKETCAEKYAEALTKAFDSMQELLERAGTPPKAKL